MRAFLIKILIALAVVSIILTVSSKVIVPSILRKQLVDFVKANFGRCIFEVDRVRFSVLPVSLILEGVRLSGGDPKSTGVDANADRIVVLTSLRSLISGELHFKAIQIYAPHVDVTEGDLPLPASGPGEGPRQIYVIDGIELVDGRFNYTRIFGTGQEARRAILHVRDIQGTVGKLGTTPPLREQMARGQAKGRLESSGGFVLSAEAALFVKSLKVDVDLQMAGQDLADVSPFFETSDGIRIEGRLNKGRSLIKIRERKLSGWVQADYQGLNLRFEKTRSRSTMSAFFSNLIKSIKLHSSTTGKTPADQTRTVELQREPREALVHFILRGMGEAAFRVAGNP